jgi:uncharacterized protein (TIGR00725 family)
MVRSPFIGVIGAGSCAPEIAELACDVGREIARHKGVLVCGGLGGVMTAAARGAKELGGYTVGILPGPNIRDANAYIDFPIATNMSHARNAIIARTAEVLIAVAGSYGTLSEIALALEMGKGVVAIQPQFDIPGVHVAKSPLEAVKEALVLIETGQQGMTQM